AGAAQAAMENKSGSNRLLLVPMGFQPTSGAHGPHGYLLRMRSIPTHRRAVAPVTAECSRPGCGAALPGAAAQSRLGTHATHGHQGEGWSRTGSNGK
ncbi:MAG: hypothetical protein JZU65_20185, partial [Chlorobium sp.]|nr:hypothetical protein [Chlorobium sp.]